MKFFISTLVLASCATSQVMAAAPTKNDLKLEVSCSLERRYLNPADPSGTPLVENLTPAGVKPLPVKIDADESSRSVPATKLSFTAQTPDGEVEVHATATAIELFGTNLQLSLSQRVDLVKPQVGIPDVGDEAGLFKYTDATISQKSEVAFTTGRTAQGHVVSEYYSTCAIVAK